MKNKRVSAALALLLCLILAFTAAACGKDVPSNTTDPTVTDGLQDRTVVGEGEKSFFFDAVLADGSTRLYTVKTDAETVGEALLAAQLIAGEDSQYGLYVKTVCGVTLDYEKDGKYWAFYINGEYASTGVDNTKITDGASYLFKAE